MPMPAAFDLSGRVAVVTGAGSPDGIGFAAASGLVAATLGQWGQLDILVNNAGMISTTSTVFESGTVDSMDQATWDAALTRNLTTAFLVTKAALPTMTSRGWGRIATASQTPGTRRRTGHPRGPRRLTQRGRRRHCLAGQPRRLLRHRAMPDRGRRQLHRRTTRHTGMTGAITRHALARIGMRERR